MKSTSKFSVFLLPLLIFALSSHAQDKVCATDAAQGICGSDPQITASGNFPVFVNNDVWGPQGAWSQTLHVTRPENWYVEAAFTNNASAIQTYPDLDVYYNGGSGPSNYNYMYSSFAETPDRSPNTIADVGYDIWLNNYSIEVMIQHDLINTPACTTWLRVDAANVQFGGTNGVPVNSWNLCQGGTELVWQIADPGGSTNFGISSGSVDIHAMLAWLISNGYVPSDSTFTALEYGFEIASTGGAKKRFAVTNFSLLSDKP